MSRLTYLFLLVPIVTLTLRAQPIIQSITIAGNEALSTRELSGAMILKPSFTLSISQLQHDVESIQQLYHNNGYYFAHVLVDSILYSADSSSVDIAIVIDEGNIALIESIRLEGNTLFTTDEITTQFDSRPGKVFSPSVLERDIDNLLHRYERQGHPFAKITIGEITPASNSSATALAVDIHIDEQMLVLINEIQVEGNKLTKSNVVVRETRLRLGEPYNHERVRTIPQRLNRLNIFSRVEEPELYITSRGGGLLIRVTEGRMNTFDGVVGYVPGSAGEKGFLTGMVNIATRNIFGTARKLNVRWQQEDRFSQELALRYIEPWVFDFPVNLSGSFFQRRQDTTYVRRTIEFKSDVLVTENLSLSGMYNHENVIPSSATSARLVFKSSTITTGLEAQYDSRDDVFSPRSGILYRSDYRIGRKKIFDLPAASPLNPRVTVQKISLDFEWFVETFSQQVLALGLHGRELRSGQIELGDLYRFGGANTMRGYRENQFLGSRIVWSNAEYRFLLARRSFLFGFFDTGYYFRPSDESRGASSVQAVKYGYGIGIRLETALGNISVSFALGKGDAFGQGKIHFGLINDF